MIIIDLIDKYYLSANVDTALAVNLHPFTFNQSEL